MTTIKYTITLVNSDGTRAVASSEVLQYAQIPSDKLQSVAEFQAGTLGRGHVAMMETISKGAHSVNGYKRAASAPGGKANGVAISK